jgi:F-type H+-transporting ATPase subunit b
VDLLAVVGAAAADVVRLAAEAEGESGGFQLNIFWILVSSLNFLFFFFVITYFAWGPLTRILDERRDRIEQGLRDADQARRDRESAEQERLATLAEARREANEILARSQKVAQESREADIAATRLELERMRTRAAADIEAEKHRAIADLRAEVADLALQAAGRVVGESMTGDRQRRLVEEFLAGSASGGGRDA